MVDLRTHTGRFFVLIGAILVGIGLLEPDLRAPLTDANVNLWSGFMMFSFGAFLLWLTTRQS